MVPRAAALFGCVLAGDRRRTRDLRVTPGTGEAALRRFRSVGRPRGCSAISLAANVSGVQRKHVPDYLLLTDSGPVVVDVKPASKLTEPKVASTLAWPRSAIQARGWGTYELWTEPPVAELRNIRFLAGFRRSAHFDGGRESRCRRNWSRIDAGGKYWLYIPHERR